MKIQTIEGIELSSLCDLNCHYCVNDQIDNVPGRSREIMQDHTFLAACCILEKLVERGTQGETLNINGNGESLLDPNLERRTKILRQIVGPGRRIQFSTNGVAMTLKRAISIKAAGIDDVQVSIHSPKHAAIAIQHLGRAGYKDLSVNAGAIGAPHEWAGQHRWLPNGVQIKLECEPRNEGRAYVQSDGTVAPCCYDFQNFGTIGSVDDKDILDRDIEPFELCRSCHQNAPPGTIREGSGTTCKE